MRGAVDLGRCKTSGGEATTTNEREATPAALRRASARRWSSLVRPSGGRPVVSFQKFRYRPPPGALATHGPCNLGRWRGHKQEGEGKQERPECGGAPARHGLNRRWRSWRRKRWTVFRLPSGWTVIAIPSTPWVPTIRPIGLLRPGFIGSRESVFLFQLVRLKPWWSAASGEAGEDCSLRRRREDGRRRSDQIRVCGSSSPPLHRRRGRLAWLLSVHCSGSSWILRPMELFA